MKELIMLELKEFKVTQRDGQILRLLLEGCSNKEIASELKISPRTVKQHLRSLFQRAGIDGGRKRVKLPTNLRSSVNQTLTRGIVGPSAALSALIEHDSEHKFFPRAAVLACAYGSLTRTRLTPFGKGIFECTNKRCKRTYDAALLLTARGRGRDGRRPSFHCRLGDFPYLIRRKLGQSI
jgi:DNA-binding CsgD family transcriptional regulator